MKKTKWSSLFNGSSRCLAHVHSMIVPSCHRHALRVFHSRNIEFLARALNVCDEHPELSDGRLLNVSQNMDRGFSRCAR
jgi:hypothetical protein